MLLPHIKNNNFEGGRKKLWEVMCMFMTLMLVMNPKLTELYMLNTHSFLHVNHTSMKWFSKKKRKKKERKPVLQESTGHIQPAGGLQLSLSPPRTQGTQIHACPHMPPPKPSHNRWCPLWSSPTRCVSNSASPLPELLLFFLVFPLLYSCLSAI